MGGGYNPIPEIRLPKLNPGLIMLGVIVVVVLAGAFTSFYTVAPDEVGVMLRLGKFQGLANPGLHFKIPFLVDTVINVKTTFVYKEEFGFQTTSAGTRSEVIDTGEAFEFERLTLSGDLNVVAVEWVMTYTVIDPYKYLFKVQKIDSTVRAVSQAAIKEVIGDYNVDEVITTEREEISTKAKIMTQEILDSYDCGIKVEDVRLRNVNPPTREVQDAFENVNRAEQQREEIIKTAQADYNRTVPREEGRARQSIEEALGNKEARINIAEGEADRFISILEEYRKARDVTRQRLYLEAWRELLPKLGRKIIVDGDLRGLVQLLNIQDTLRGGGNR